MPSKLSSSFYRRPTVEVARDLLGKILVHREDSGMVSSGIIVEVEAYGGQHGRDDRASHAFRGKTERNRAMFEAGGVAYVYFIYGMYFCFNVVTEAKGSGAAVLIRALEPLEGIEHMCARRKTTDIVKLTNGPGKLCMAMNIDRQLTGKSLRSGRIHIVDSGVQPRIRQSARIGIRKSAEKKWRFYIGNSKFLSR